MPWSSQNEHVVEFIRRSEAKRKRTVGSALARTYQKTGDALRRSAGLVVPIFDKADTAEICFFRETDEAVGKRADLPLKTTARECNRHDPRKYAGDDGRRNWSAQNTGTTSSHLMPSRWIGLLAGYTTDHAADQTADSPEHRIEHAGDGAKFAA